jgi:hypothetical protein
MDLLYERSPLFTQLPRRGILGYSVSGVRESRTLKKSQSKGKKRVGAISGKADWWMGFENLFLISCFHKRV